MRAIICDACGKTVQQCTEIKADTETGGKRKVVIPTTINICGVPHTVTLCKDNFTVDSHFGEIEYTQAAIKINQDMPEAMQQQALCHEWLHGALVMLGFNEESQNEQFVQALSMAINQTFTVKGGGA